MESISGEPPARMKLFWAFLIGAMAVLFLLVAGVAATQALQTTSIVTGLPILLIELVSMIGLAKVFKGRATTSQMTREAEARNRDSEVVRVLPNEGVVPMVRDDHWLPERGGVLVGEEGAAGAQTP
jgi:choline-glycine betaine transporter